MKKSGGKTPKCYSGGRKDKNGNPIAETTHTRNKNAAKAKAAEEAKSTKTVSEAAKPTAKVKATTKSTKKEPPKASTSKSTKKVSGGKRASPVAQGGRTKKKTKTNDPLSVSSTSKKDDNEPVTIDSSSGETEDDDSSMEAAMEMPVRKVRNQRGASDSSSSSASSKPSVKKSKRPPPLDPKTGKPLKASTVEYWKARYKEAVQDTNDRLVKARTVLNNKNNEIEGLKVTVKHLGDSIPKGMVDDETKKKVWKTCKNEFFRTVKFISSEKQLVQVTEDILDSYEWDDYMYFEEEEDETAEDRKQRQKNNDIVAANRATWIKTYQKEVLSAFNKRRSYTQEWCKDEVTKLLHAGKVPPHPKAIKKCAMWKINPKNADEMKVYAWYWDKLLPGVGGAKHYWSPSIRHHCTISKAHLNNAENKLCIPVSSEAFIVLVYEGCYDKWLAMHKWQKENPNKKFHREMEERKKPIYKSKYFETTSGQKLFGGVPAETLQLFVQLKDAIKKGRKTPKTAKLEEACLALVQEENQVAEDDEEEDAEGSGKKNKKGRAKMMEEEIETFGDEE